MIERLSIHNAKVVAHLYGESYRQLSTQYKTPEEMALYTPTYFEQKVQNFLKEKHSAVFVQTVDGRPVGFVRYSPVPAAYHQPALPLVIQPETGTLDGVRYHFDREIDFSTPTQMSETTLALNQIYFAPDCQRGGLGCALLHDTLAQMAGQYKDIVVEYNLSNTTAQKFYNKLGFRQIATTYDLDHIINGKYYFSAVGIAHAPIQKCQEQLARRIARHKSKINPNNKGQQHAH